jgi:glucose/arabinose dehydrogenase
VNRLSFVPLLATALLLAAAPAYGFTLEQLTPTFDQPVYVSAPPGDPDRLLVVEKGGRIQLVVGGVKASAPYLDLSARVDTDGEEGMLSIAFPSADRFYVLFNEDLGQDGVKGSDIVVERYDVEAGGDAADPSTGVEILRVPHHGGLQGDNHNGGQLQIGPDGNLWMSTGDGGGNVGRDRDGNAQNPEDPLGKLLRVAPREEGGHDIPAGNPYASGGGVPEIWATGLRNPWRFSFDRGTGELYIGDVGESAIEEVDRLPAPALGCAANFGWPWYEGTSVLASNTQPATHEPPVVEHTHEDGDADGPWQAVTGGYVIRDPALEEAGKYVYGDFNVDQLWLYDPATGSTTATSVTIPLLVSFGEDGLGRVHAASLDGHVYRLENAAGENGTAPAPATFAVPGCKAPVATKGESGGGEAPAEEPAPEPPTPPGPGPSTGGGPPPAPLRLKAGTARTQRAVRRRAVIARAECSLDCRLELTGRLTVGRASFRLRRARASLKARVPAVLRARLGARARRAARRALRRGRRVRIQLTLTATAPHGETVTQALAVVVRR